MEEKFNDLFFFFEKKIKNEKWLLKNEIMV